MPRVALPIQTYQDAEGNPLSFGYIVIRLNEDAKTPDPAQIASQFSTTVNLDTNGTVIGSPMVWPTADLVPSTTLYLISSYTIKGQRLTYEVPTTV